MKDHRCQPELVQPSSIDCEGKDLADTVAEVQQAGAVIVGMAQGRTNSEWRLTLHWPPQSKDSFPPIEESGDATF
jgi:hypothetical protein